MSSIQFQTNTTAELAAIRMENAEMKILIKTLLAQPPTPTATKKTKKTKTVPATEAEAEAGAEASASGEPKEKRPASAWILFSSKQVQPLIRAAEEGIDKSEKTKVGTLNQFAGQLWSQKKEWSNEEITAAWAQFTPPEVSKQTLEGKSKRSGSSTGSAEKADPVADEVDAGKKTRKPMSEEAKKAAAEKRALTKAAKTATTTPTVAPEQVSETPVVATKAKNTKFAPKPAKKVVDLNLDLWTHDGTEYLKNERGDVLTVDGEWVGLWNGKSIDETAVEPSDFEQLQTRD